MSPIQALRNFAVEEGLTLIDNVSDDCLLAPLDYAEDDTEVLNTEEEKEVDVAVDSGCVSHCTNPESLPRSVSVVKHPPGTKDFVGAGGEGIKRHGKAALVLEQENGDMVGNVMQVAEVIRPLHSVSEIADTDKDILFTRGECVVVPGGSLARYVKGLKVYTKYLRRGGLYSARMKFRDPKKLAKSPNEGFGRQGAAQ